MQLCFKDIKGKLQKDTMVEFDKCPAGGTTSVGRLNVKFAKKKESLEKYVSNQRLSVLQWEALH